MDKIMHEKKQTNLFLTIRNLFIKDLGAELIEISEKLFTLKKRQLRKIITSETETQLAVQLSPKAKKMIIREKPHYWVKVLGRVLRKNSGDGSGSTLRSPWDRTSLYDLFKTGYYMEALDLQVSTEPAFIEEVTKMSPEEYPTRFQRNILTLLKRKQENKEKVYQADPGN